MILPPTPSSHNDDWETVTFCFSFFKPIQTILDIYGHCWEDANPSSFLSSPPHVARGVKSKRERETAFPEELHFGEAAFLCAGKRKGRSILFLFV